MSAHKVKLSAFVITIACILAISGCRHNQQTTKVTPPPPGVTPASPVATITATPDTVDQGQPVQLSWNTQNASSVTIEGLGTVVASGSQRLTPNASTTYHLVAKGDGGSAEANARVTVNMPKKNEVSEVSEEQLFAQNIKDIFFSYDNYDVREDQRAALNADADFLAKHPNINLVIEGHCDERGSEDYNMGLGENRASSVKSVLEKHGVSADRVRVISLGKEKPFCTAAETESCWQENRRAHFVFARNERASN